MALKIQICVALLGLCALTSSSILEKDFYIGFNTLVREGRETLELRNSVKDIKFPQLFRGNYKPSKINEISTLVCKVCDLALDIVITAAQNGTSIDFVADGLAYLCSNFIIESEEVCRSLIDINKDTIYYILTDEKSKATSERICSMLLQDFKCIDSNANPWQIEIAPALPKNTSSVVKKNEDSKAAQIKVIQLTDMHYDPNYEVGSNAACVEPLCCQAGSKPSTPEDAAGYWGDYRNCDLPWHHVIDILDQIVITHTDMAYVYFTGDIIDHKVWKTDIQTNTEAIVKVYQQFKKAFGNLPIYPILGNHEPHPVNQYAYNIENNYEFSSKWIFELAANEWSRWLPENTRDTILKGGYYTVTTKDGLRIIALNSNVCYTFNFWLFYDDIDPFGQLQWLSDTLAEAENNGEKVHILSHVPTGDSTCLHNWSNEYAKIINRFSEIISAQFNGHTHSDDTVIFYTPDNSRATNIAFNGGSLTSYSNLNPNYKAYYIDSSTYNVLDYETWSYNLTEANWNPQVSPQWHVLYHFKKQYGLEEVTPKSVSDLVEKMALESNSDLLQKYYKNQVRDADPALAGGCDSECEIKNLCYMVTYVHGNDVTCKQLTNSYNSAHPPKL